MKLIKDIPKIIFLLICLPFVAQSQLVNNGGAITVQNGAVIFTSASFTNTSTATFDNNGELITGADIINDTAATLSGNGTYSVQANFTNSGTYNYGTSTLNFFGTGNSNLKNKGGTIYKLIINKTTNYLVNLLDNEKVNDSVIFLTDKNWIKLNSKIFTISQNCKIQNYSDQRFFITNGTGTLKKLGLGTTPFVFPVGFNANTYNQLTITENGTKDAYRVRCRDSALLNGSSGKGISNGGISAGWVIAEGVAGGANATIEAQWNTTDELPGFNYLKCLVSRYDGTKWTFVGTQTGAATGTTYRSISKSGFTSLGDFTVLSTKTPSFTTIIPGDGTVEAASKSLADDINIKLKIYPTLVQNSFNLDVPGNLKNIQQMNLLITDMNGRVVWQKQNADFISQRILLPDLASGMYLVTVDYNNNRFTQKIIISH